MAKHLLLSFGIILAVGILCGFLSQKIKVPDVAIFLVVGMLMGPAVSGILNIPAESVLNQIIILFGACYILFDGGASFTNVTRRTVRPGLRSFVSRAISSRAATPEALSLAPGAQIIASVT